MERLLTFKEFTEKTVILKTLRKGLESARRKDKLTLQKEILHQTDEVRESFCDDTGNYRKWLVGDVCSFFHPITHNRIDVQIGDDCEAIYHFLIFCMKLNAHEDVSDESVEYLSYLISRSLYETEEC